MTDTVARDTTADTGDVTDTEDAADTGDAVDIGDTGGPADTSDAGDAGSQGRVFAWDFDEGAQEWEASFADYSLDQKDGIDFQSGLRPLPDELEKDGDGFFVAGTNSPDDLFMFLKRSVGGDSTLAANTKYRLHETITYANRDHDHDGAASTAQPLRSPTLFA